MLQFVGFQFRKAESFYTFGLYQTLTATAMEALFKTLLLLHIAAGTVTLVSGPVSMMNRKGGKQHRLTGKVFFYAMMLVTVTAIAMALLPGHHSPFLLIIGVLADGLSFEIFEQVPVEVPVIFTTAYDAYAIKAFKVNSIGYLLKPIYADELQAALEKFRKLSHSSTAALPQLRTLEQAMQLLSGKKNYKNQFVVKGG